MPDRKKLIYGAIKNNPYAKLPTISVDIKARTGTGVAIPKLMQLRDAVAAGTFDSVYEASSTRRQFSPSVGRAARARLRPMFPRRFTRAMSRPWVRLPLR